MRTLEQIMPGFREDVLEGKPPELWRTGAPAWDGFENGPGLMTLIGGAPGSGKTALTMQIVIDALRANTDLRALVANIEMTPEVLLERQTARLSGLALDRIRFREKAAVSSWPMTGALDTLAGLGDRLAFHDGSATLRGVAESADEHGANWIVCDYIQRLRDDVGAEREQRAELDCMLNRLRSWASGGLGLTLVSSVARQKGSRGSDYAGLGLASFRGSSELEYAADSAWVLEPPAPSKGKDAAPVDPNELSFTCVKNRHGNTPTMRLSFDRPRQSFTVRSDGSPWEGMAGPTAAKRQPAPYAADDFEGDFDEVL